MLSISSFSTCQIFGPDLTCPVAATLSLDTVQQEWECTCPWTHQKDSKTAFYTSDKSAVRHQPAAMLHENEALQARQWADLDLHEVGLLLADVDLADLGVGQHADGCAVLLHGVQLLLDGLTDRLSASCCTL